MPRGGADERSDARSCGIRAREALGGGASQFGRRSERIFLRKHPSEQRSPLVRNTLTIRRLARGPSLRPAGFDRAAAWPASIAALGVDAEFLGGAEAAHREVDVTGGIRPLTVEAEFLCQSLSVRWAGERFARRAPYVLEFEAMYESADRGQELVAKTERTVPQRSKEEANPPNGASLSIRQGQVYRSRFSCRPLSGGRPPSRDLSVPTRFRERRAAPLETRLRLPRVDRGAADTNPRPPAS